jgi:hypothetical protein
MKKKQVFGYIARFSLVHVLTYIAAGMTFMFLQNYASVFATSDLFANFRPIDSPIVRAGPLLQFLRGGFFAAILYPFYQKIMESKRGWLMLFSVLWGFTLIGSVTAAAGSIEGMIYTNATLAEHLIGIPEVTIQMLLFSVLFFLWERKVYNKRNSKDLNVRQ